MMVGAASEKSKLWGMSLWAWSAVVVAAMLLFLMLADRGGVPGGEAWDAIRRAVGEQRTIRWMFWLSPRLHRHDALSVAFVFVGVASLHVSSVRGRGWRIVLFGLWFGFGAVTLEPVFEQALWRPFDIYDWFGAMVAICSGGLLSFYVGAVAIPSMSVRALWGLMWLSGLPSGFVRNPSLSRALDSANEGLPYVLMAAMVIWAIRARRSIVAAGCCRACGYDLSATDEAMPCPECGAVGSRVVAGMGRTNADVEQEKGAKP